MIEEVEKTDILNPSAEWIVIPVNCYAFCDKVIADRYPEMFTVLREFCSNDYMKQGVVLTIHGAPNCDNTNKTNIICLPVADRYDITKEFIESGLDRIIELIDERDIHSIEFPRIMKPGNRDFWNEIKMLIINKFDKIEKLKIILPR